MNTVDKIVMKKIGTIKPYEKNPRDNAKTVDLLVNIIPKVGFNVPILVDINNVIVKGHARYLAAKKLGLDEVPCVVTYADEETIKLDRIADNKISEFSEWVNDELLHELEALNIDFDFGQLDLPNVNTFDVPEFKDIDKPFAPIVSQQEDSGDLMNRNDYKNDYMMPQSDNDAVERYRKFLEQQEKENSTEMHMTSQRALDSAKEAQRNIGTKHQRYAKVECDECGYTFYVSENYLRSF